MKCDLLHLFPQAVLCDFQGLKVSQRRVHTFSG